MILSIDELYGKALDWAYEEACNPDMRDIKCENGNILIILGDDYGPPGWYFYKSRVEGKNVDEVKAFIRSRLGDLVVVPTDLISPRHNNHFSKGLVINPPEIKTK